MGRVLITLPLDPHNTGSTWQCPWWTTKCWYLYYFILETTSLSRVNSALQISLLIYYYTMQVKICGGTGFMSASFFRRSHASKLWSIIDQDLRVRAVQFFSHGLYMTMNLFTASIRRSSTQFPGGIDRITCNEIALDYQIGKYSFSLGIHFNWIHQNMFIRNMEPWQWKLAEYRYATGDAVAHWENSSQMAAFDYYYYYLLFVFKACP